MSINKNELDIWAPEWNNAPRDLKGATPGQVANILDKTPDQEQIRDWIDNHWWKAVIRHACDQHKPSERTAIYQEAINNLNVRDNSQKLPSDPEELYQIIFEKKPKYNDTIFHEIHNYLFPEEYIDFYMRKEEFIDWYNDPDEAGITGKWYIEFGKSDSFWVRWQLLVTTINESRRNLGRWLLRTHPSTFIAQIPWQLKKESGIENMILAWAHPKWLTRRKRRETWIPKKSSSIIDWNTNSPLIDNPEKAVLLPSFQTTIPSTPGKVADILDNDSRRAQIIEWINLGWWKSLIQQACKKNWYNIRKLIYQEELWRQKRNPHKSYILPSDPIDLYQIIFREKPKYKDSIFHKIFNYLFPTEYIDYFMRSDEFTDWYNTPDENGKTGKDYIVIWVGDNFGDEWEKLVTSINESQRALGRWLIKTTLSTLKLQMPISLREDSRINTFRKKTNNVLIWEPDNDDEESDKWLRYWNTGPRDKRNKQVSSSPSRMNKDFTDEQKEQMEWLFIDAIEKGEIWKKTSSKVFLSWISGKDEKTKKEIYMRRWVVLDSQIRTLQWLHSEKIVRLCITYFIRALASMGVPPGVFISEYIVFDADNLEDIRVRLHPIFLEHIGWEKLDNICSEITTKIDHLSEWVSDKNAKHYNPCTLLVERL